MGKTDDARHHLVADLDFNFELARSRTDARAFSVSEAARLRVIRVNEQNASRFTLRQIWQIVQPRIHAAALSPSNHEKTGRASEVFQTPGKARYVICDQRVGQIDPSSLGSEDVREARRKRTQIYGGSRCFDLLEIQTVGILTEVVTIGPAAEL